MALTNYSLTPAASATNRYTAAADIDVRLSNPSEWHVMAWTLTTSDVAPVAEPSNWNKIKPLEGQAMTLTMGERLWMACPSGRPLVAALEV